MKDALELAEKPSGLARHIAQLADATAEIATHYRVVGKWDAAFKLVEAALELELQDVQQARLWSELGQLLERRADYDRAREVLGKAQKIGEAQGDQRLLADVLYNLGELDYFECFFHQRHDHQAALALHEQVSAMREASGDQEGQCFSLSRLGTIHERLGDMDKALDYFERSKALGEAIGFEVGTWRPIVHIGFHLINKGETEQVLAHQIQARDITQRHQIADGLVYTLVNVAYAQFLVDGDMEKAMEAATKGLKLAEEIQFYSGWGRDLYMLGTIAMEGGDRQTAIEYFEATFEFCEKYELGRFRDMAEKNLKALREEVAT